MKDTVVSANVTLFGKKRKMEHETKEKTAKRSEKGRGEGSQSAGLQVRGGIRVIRSAGVSTL